MDHITITGARTHNLKNISVSIKRDQLIVITGPSGSGKSSLAFDTIYAEGQRRYVESLSTYARQFLSVMEKPDVDSIEGLSPAIAIEQKSTSHNPRSTVGTVTEVYDFLRLLFARVGSPYCPTHNVKLSMQTVSQVVDTLMAYPENTGLIILSPLVQEKKGTHQPLFDKLKKEGFLRVQINQKIYELDDLPTLNKQNKYTIEAVIDRLKIKSGLEQRLADSIETAFRLSDGLVSVQNHETGKATLFSSRHACPHCGYSVPALEPKLFSFNSPAGACPSCDGLGVEQVFDPTLVIPNPEISLAAGAIKGWDRRNAYYFSMLESLAKHFAFSLTTPFNELPKSVQTIILFGSDELISFRLGKEKRSVKEIFEGVIPLITRRYHETQSIAVQEDLAQLIAWQACKACEGTRLCTAAHSVFVGSKTLPAVTTLTIEDCVTFLSDLALSGKEATIAKKVLKEIIERLTFLKDVGLDYLTLNRSAETLSGGEAQRIRLASQIGAGLVGVTYVLDEPSIGLHQRDNQRLLKTLFRLRDLGNTVIVVEHDEDAIRSSDHVIDIGPGAGIHGGTVVAEGTPSAIEANPQSITGQYLSGKRRIAIPKTRLSVDPKRQIIIQNASGNNLKNVTVAIPLGIMTCITGVSGSGKSTLINDTLFPAAAKILNGATALESTACDNIVGMDQLDKVIDIDQSPIGRTPRSNPATYTGLFTPIRDLFAGTQEARSRGYLAGRFSFNVKGGRCEACEGDGVTKVEMHFLSDIFVTCDVCHGQRYNRETLEVKYKGKSIFDILDMTVEDAATFFAPIPTIFRKLETLMQVGLSYIKLGQNATTLSGGEAQRVKLAKELSRASTGNTLYILDEPTTGLHFQDVDQLLKVLFYLREKGNTIVIIEHNLDVIKVADWIIDLGPEGGAKGGQIVAEGTPEQVAKNKHSATGHFLEKMLRE